MIYHKYALIDCLRIPLYNVNNVVQKGKGPKERLLPQMRVPWDLVQKP